MDFTKLPIGTKVYMFGNKDYEGEIVEIHKPAMNFPYPVVVRFRGGGRPGFTFDGRHYVDRPPCLTLRPFEIPAECFELPEPSEPTFEKDEKVMVSRDNKDWMKRYYQHYGNDGLHYCYSHLSDAWSGLRVEARGWRFVRKPTAEELEG